MALADVTYYWKLDEASGTRVASVGGQNLVVGTDTGPFDGEGQEGRLGRCANWWNKWTRYWGSVGVQLITSNTLANTIFQGPLSANFWIKWSDSAHSSSDSGTLVGQYDWYGGDGTFMLQQVSSNLVNFYTVASDGNHTLSTSGAPSLVGKWHMITATYDNSSKQKNIYIDGVNYGQATASHTNNLGYTHYDAGNVKFNINGNPSLNGSMGNKCAPSNFQHVGIWTNYVLTQTDITTLYNNSAGLQYPFFSAQAMKFRS